MAGRPRSGAERLTRAGIVTAAVELADAEGLAALSMRSVAQRLGVTPMSLYNHVANKEELLNGMVDAVFAEFYAPVPGAEWRSELRRRAVTARETLKRHPWAVGLMDSRRNAGYETLLHHDAVIGCLREAGFSLTLTGHAFAVLDAHLYGFLIQEVSLPFQPGQDLAELGQPDRGCTAGGPAAVLPRVHPRARAPARLRLRRRVRGRARPGPRCSRPAA